MDALPHTSLPYRPVAPGYLLTGPVSEELAECLKPLLATGYPHISQAADLLSCSVRTLQRRLHEEGTTYSEVVDHTRRKSAVNALLQSDIRLPELAAELGYSEQSAFTRAFRRWTGSTPNRYRTERPVSEASL